MLNLLIVEDERIIRQGLIYTIDWTELGIAIIGEASNGLEGLEKIIALKPDIVLTDIKMPMMDGIQMLEAASKEHSFQKLILTSYSDFSYAQKGIRLGVFDYILKPVDERILKETIKRLTNKIGDYRKLEKTNEKMSYYEELLEDEKYTIESTNMYVGQCLDFIKENYQQRITKEEIADHLNVSTSYLSRVFKKETNLTIMDFLNRYRVMKAISLLQTHNYRIYEIAHEVGFTDYKHFSTVFKKYISKTPGEFISKEKQKE